jgi:hypothetical protein
MAGEFDAKDGIASQYKWMRELLNVREDFWNQDRKIYYYKGIDGSTQVGGYYQEEYSFTLLAVPKSGHFIPADNYYASKAYLDDIVANGKLTCHAETCSVVDKMCAAMNNCNGNGACGTNGQCTCSSNSIKGADCAYRAAKNDPSKEVQGWSCTTSGTEWCYYMMSKEMASNDLEITIESSKMPVTVYIGYGEASNPGKFEYDVIFKNVDANRKLKLNKDTVPHDGGYTVALEVHGYDYGKNIPFANTVTIDSKTRGSADVEITEREAILGRLQSNESPEVLFMQ